MAEIWANVKSKNINQTYTYIVPERLNFITSGWRVKVSFGRYNIDGFVVKVYEYNGDFSEFDYNFKEITEIIDDEAWFTDEMIKESQWMQN